MNKTYEVIEVDENDVLDLYESDLVRTAIELNHVGASFLNHSKKNSHMLVLSKAVGDKMRGKLRNGLYLEFPLIYLRVLSAYYSEDYVEVFGVISDGN